MKKFSLKSAESTIARVIRAWVKRHGCGNTAFDETVPMLAPRIASALGFKERPAKKIAAPPKSKRRTVCEGMRFLDKSETAWTVVRKASNRVHGLDALWFCFPTHAGLKNSSLRPFGSVFILANRTPFQPKRAR